MNHLEVLRDEFEMVVSLSDKEKHQIFIDGPVDKLYAAADYAKAHKKAILYKLYNEWLDSYVSTGKKADIQEKTKILQWKDEIERSMMLTGS